MFATSFQGVLVLGFIVWIFSARDTSQFLNKRRVWIAQSLVFIGIVGTVFVASRSVREQVPVAASDLREGESLQVPVSGPLALMVHGSMPSVSYGQSATEDYTLSLLDAEGNVVITDQGHFSEHWGKRRMGRRVKVSALIGVDEGRLKVPASLTGVPFSVRVDRVHGKTAGFIRVFAVRAPLPLWPIGVLGFGLATLGAGVDLYEHERSRTSLLLGFLMVFSAAVSSLIPHQGIRVLGGPTLLGVIVGLPTGYAVRLVLRWVLARTPWAAPAVQRAD